MQVSLASRVGEPTLHAGIFDRMQPGVVHTTFHRVKAHNLTLIVLARHDGGCLSAAPNAYTEIPIRR